jgi:hypothetical protein
MVYLCIECVVPPIAVLLFYSPSFLLALPLNHAKLLKTFSSNGRMDIILRCKGAKAVLYWWLGGGECATGRFVPYILRSWGSL